MFSNLKMHLRRQMLCDNFKDECQQIAVRLILALWAKETEEQLASEQNGEKWFSHKYKFLQMMLHVTPALYFQEEYSFCDGKSEGVEGGWLSIGVCFWNIFFWEQLDDISVCWYTYKTLWSSSRPDYLAIKTKEQH